MGSIEQIKKHYGFTAGDAENLRQLQPIMARNGKRVLDEFYRYIMGIEGASRFLKDEETIRRHREKLTAWFMNLFSGSYNDEYLNDLERIGYVHVKINLNAHYVNAAMHFIKQRCMGIIGAEIGNEGRRHGLSASVDKMLDINLDAMTSSFIMEADRLKSQITANMSHELKTPLNAVIGFAEVLLDGMDGEINDVMRRDLTYIHESGLHLLSLINDILDLSKIEAGRVELVKEEVDLNGIIRGVVSEAQAMIKGKDIKLMAMVDENIPSITADGNRVRQIVSNIVSNAAKFTERGEIEIRAGLTEKGVLITVRDTGIGIGGEDIPKVFEKFRQVDMKGTRVKGGVGLGMAIAKRLVEMHGGEIRLESKVGAGTTFSVILPVNS